MAIYGHKSCRPNTENIFSIQEKMSNYVVHLYLGAWFTEKMKYCAFLEFVCVRNISRSKDLNDVLLKIDLSNLETVCHTMYAIHATTVQEF